MVLQVYSLSPVVQGQDAVFESHHLLLEVKGRDVVHSQRVISEGHDDLVDIRHDNQICDPREPRSCALNLVRLILHELQ